MQESQESNTVCFFLFLTVPPLSVSLQANIFEAESLVLSSLSPLLLFSLILPSCHHLFDTDVVQRPYFILFKNQSYSCCIAPRTPSETC